MAFTDRLMEFFGLKRTKETTLGQILVGQQNRFLEGIYGERVLTPHEEMREAKRLFNYNGFVAAAVQTFKDFILGSEQRVDAEDMATEEYLNKWLEEIGFFDALPEIVENFIVTGNAYLEVERSTDGRIVKVWPIADSSRIYVVADPFGNTLHYIQELPPNTRVEGADFHKFYYWGRTPRTVYGIKIPKDRLIHFRWGKADLPIYGRSPLASVVNDAKILRELERDIAVIARYKAVPKKWINIPKASAEKLRLLGQYLSQLADTENPITGEEKIESIDLSYSGKEINLEPYITYLKRKITSALAPEYIIHGEDVNRATSKEQLRAYMMRVNSVRDQIARVIEGQLLVPHAMALGLNRESLRFQFLDYEYKDEQEFRQEILQQFQVGLITLNEAREELGLDPIEGGEVFSWELQGAGASLIEQDDSTEEMFHRVKEAKKKRPESPGG